MTYKKRGRPTVERQKRGRKSKRVKQDDKEDSDGDKEWDNDAFRVVVGDDHEGAEEFEAGEYIETIPLSLDDELSLEFILAAQGRYRRDTEGKHVGQELEWVSVSFTVLSRPVDGLNSAIW